MSAAVLRFPAADQPPVKQLPRRGPLPRAVTNLRLFASDRACDLERAKQVTKLKEQLSIRRDMASAHRKVLAMSVFQQAAHARNYAAQYLPIAEGMVKETQDELARYEAQA
jgi:hypothetical protein